MSRNHCLHFLCLVLPLIVGCNGKPALDVWRWEVQPEYYSQLQRRTGEVGEGAIALSESELADGVRFLSVKVFVAPKDIWKVADDGGFSCSLRSFQLLVPGEPPIPARAVDYHSPKGEFAGYSEMELQRSQTGDEDSFAVIFAVSRRLQERNDLRFGYGELPPQPLNETNHFVPNAGTFATPPSTTQ